MSQAPSTLGTITTSSWSPISVTSVVRSSSTQGLSSELTRVQSAVWPKSDSLAALIRPGARGLLAVDRDRVLEVAEQDVGLLGDAGRLFDHLLVGEVEEVDHPRGLDRDLAQRLGGADRLRLEEVSGVSHAAPRVARFVGRAEIYPNARSVQGGGVRRPPPYFAGDGRRRAATARRTGCSPSSRGRR